MESVNNSPLKVKITEEEGITQNKDAVLVKIDNQVTSEVVDELPEEPKSNTVYLLKSDKGQHYFRSFDSKVVLKDAIKDNDFFEFAICGNNKKHEGTPGVDNPVPIDFVSGKVTIHVDDYQFEIDLPRELRGLDEFNPDKIYRKSDGTWWISEGVIKKEFNSSTINNTTVIPSTDGFSLGTSPYKDSSYDFGRFDATYSDSVYATRFTYSNGDSTPVYARGIDTTGLMMIESTAQMSDSAGTTGTPALSLIAYRVYFGVKGFTATTSPAIIKEYISEHPFEVYFTQPIVYSMTDVAQINDERLVATLNDMYNQIKPNSVISIDSEGDVEPKLSIVYECANPTVGYEFIDGKWNTVPNTNSLTVRLNEVSSLTRGTVRFRELVDLFNAGGDVYYEINSLAYYSYNNYVSKFKINGFGSHNGNAQYGVVENSCFAAVSIMRRSADFNMLNCRYLDASKYYVSQSGILKDDYSYWFSFDESPIYNMYDDTVRSFSTYAKGRGIIIRVLTQSEYDNIKTKGSNTIYMIKAS